MQQSAHSAEQIGKASVPMEVPMEVPGQQKACKQQHGACVQAEVLKHESHELELV